jgi:hypothetical protein
MDSCAIIQGSIYFGSLRFYDGIRKMIVSLGKAIIIPKVGGSRYEADKYR